MKGIGLLGLVTAFLLLCSALSFRPAPKMYRAKPQDMPSWAEQGNFRFIRLDGGRIESWKAERTWWGNKFSAEEKDVLTHIYDRDFEQMLGLLKQAEFNWIWVTWSSGWSFKDEDENRSLQHSESPQLRQPHLSLEATFFPLYGTGGAG